MDKYSTIPKNTKISKKLFIMKSRIINNCRYVYAVLVERIMEFAEYIKFKLKRGDEYRSNLVEIYNIKEKKINEKYVQEFLRERAKCVGPDRYRIEIRADRSPGDEETVGEVLLMRKSKLIEKATLVTKKNTPDSEKLIYWKY